MDESGAVDFSVYVTAYFAIVLATIWKAMQFHSRLVKNENEELTKNLKVRMKEAVIDMRGYLIQTSMLKCNTSLKDSIGLSEYQAKSYVRSMSDNEVVDEFVRSSIELGFGTIPRSLTRELVESLGLRSRAERLVMSLEGENSAHRARNFLERVESGCPSLHLQEIYCEQTDEERERSRELVQESRQLSGECEAIRTSVKMVDLQIENVEPSSDRNFLVLSTDESNEGPMEGVVDYWKQVEEDLLKDLTELENPSYETEDECSFAEKDQEDRSASDKEPRKRMGKGLSFHGISTMLMLCSLVTVALSDQFVITNKVTHKSYQSVCPISRNITKIAGSHGLPYGWMNYPMVVNAILEHSGAPWQERLDTVRRIASSLPDSDEREFMRCYISRKAYRSGHLHEKWDVGIILRSPVISSSSKSDGSGSESSDSAESDGSDGSSGSTDSVSSDESSGSSDGRNALRERTTRNGKVIKKRREVNGESKSG